ncbi:MAG: DUF6051 family protein [Bacteroidaceae bacterium]
MNTVHNQCINLTMNAPYLKSILKNSVNTFLKDNQVKVNYYNFDESSPSMVSDTLKKTKSWQHNFKVPPLGTIPDDEISENNQFEYPVFSPINMTESDDAIILLHGLNERDWEKYGCWAEQLVLSTGKPVILFPIAFHMNRSPKNWNNPRDMIKWVNKDKPATNLTFANVALSERMITSPERFYLFIRETILNIIQLKEQIEQGNHPLFKSTCHVDFFCYSIGGLVSQILFQADPYKQFTNSKLFLFCGGGIFHELNGNSRFIMSGEAFHVLKKYYSNEFEIGDRDAIYYAACNHFNTNCNPNERMAYYATNANRIKIISLKKDSVIPTSSIESCLGSKVAATCLKEMDFDLDYSHEIPFPLTKDKSEKANDMFKVVMTIASDFLG